MPFSKINWDALGVTTTIACAIHCAVLPLLFTSFPIFGINFIENAVFEYVMIGIAFVIGAKALYHGFQKHHHSYMPFTIFTFGIIMLVCKQLWHNWQIYFLIPAVIAIITAHYYNYKLCRHQNHTHKDSCKH